MIYAYLIILKTTVLGNIPSWILLVLYSLFTTNKCIVLTTMPLLKYRFVCSWLMCKAPRCNPNWYAKKQKGWYIQVYSHKTRTLSIDNRHGRNADEHYYRCDSLVALADSHHWQSLITVTSIASSVSIDRDAYPSLINPHGKGMSVRYYYRPIIGLVFYTTSTHL